MEPTPREQPTDISPTDPQGPVRIASLREAVAGFPVHQPPDALYRFTSARGISSLTEGLLKITPPIEFNDPFEVWAGLSPEVLTTERILRSVFLPTGLYRMSRLANYPGYDLKAFDDELAEAIKATPEFYRQYFKVLVDGVARSCAQQFGVCCFSGFTPAEFRGELGIHHWAMYADSHQGFALAYDGRHPQMVGFSQTKWFFPIEYVDQRVTVQLEYFDQWDDAKMVATFRRWLALKARGAWEHEKEWRFAITIGGVPAEVFHQIPISPNRNAYFIRLWEPGKTEGETAARASVITAAYLGVRASKELRKQLADAVEVPHLRHIDLYQMELDETRYALVPQLVRKGTPVSADVRRGLSAAVG